MKKIVWIIVGIILLAGIYIIANRDQMTPASTTQQTSTTPTSSTSEKVYALLPEWFPEARWTSPKATTQETYYGNISGEERTATITTDKATVPHFGQSVDFRDMGFDADKNLDADGPGSSTWGYSKTVDGKKHIVTFGYKTEPTNSNPNEPVQFNCPCKTTLSVFIGN